MKAAGLKIIDTILISYTELIANPVAYDDPAKRHAMGQVHTLLAGALEARGRVLVKLNVSEEAFERVIAIAAVDEVADRRRSCSGTTATRSRPSSRRTRSTC